MSDITDDAAIVRDALSSITIRFANRVDHHVDRGAHAKAQTNEQFRLKAILAAGAFSRIIAERDTLARQLAALEKPSDAVVDAAVVRAWEVYQAMSAIHGEKSIPTWDGLQSLAVNSYGMKRIVDGRGAEARAALSAAVATAKEGK